LGAGLGLPPNSITGDIAAAVGVRATRLAAVL
jgi:hypothetical protein